MAVNLFSLLTIFATLVLLTCPDLSQGQTVWDPTVQANAPQEWNFNSGTEQVWYGNTLIYENYMGKKSIEYNASFDYNTQFRICSNSKLFTAVSIMQLVDRGIISSIYDNINNYLNATDFQAWGLPKGTTKWCPTVYNDATKTCQNVTFVSLMSMSSGVIASITCPYSPSQWQTAYCLPQWNGTIYSGSIATTIGYFINNPLQWVPGPAYGPTEQNTYNYANENFIILSYMIQKLSGLSLQDYYQTYIFTPAALSNTFFDPWSQAFLIKPQLASEYYFYTNYYNGTVETDQSFAYGSCTSTEYNPGFQSGSGGIVSTVPDMIKWYSTLFITKNASLLSEHSLQMVLFPWSMEEGYPIQYYGLGIEMLFQNPYLTLPSVNSNIQTPISIYYMGGSMCTFFTMMIYNTSYNYFTGQPLQTYPMISAVARNNRILNITQQSYHQVPNLLKGSWFTITDFPYGWGSSNGDLTDTFYEALNLVMYFEAYAFAPAPSPTLAPTSSPVNSNSNSADDDNIGSVSAPGFVALVTIIPLCVLNALTLWYFCTYWSPKKGMASQDHVGDNAL